MKTYNLIFRLFIFAICLQFLAACSKGDKTGAVNQRTEATEQKYYDMASLPPPPPQPMAMDEPLKDREINEVIATEKEVVNKLADEEKAKRENTDEFNKIVENPFVTPQVNPLSTFSIDVDNASYTNCRSLINN